MPYNETQLEHGYNVLALLLHDPNLNPEGADLAIAQLLLASAPSGTSNGSVSGARNGKGGSGGGSLYSKFVTARTGVMRRTPLHLAVGTGLGMQRDAQRAAVLELLLDHPDVDVNAVDALGVRPARHCNARSSAAVQSARASCLHAMVASALRLNHFHAARLVLLHQLAHSAIISQFDASGHSCGFSTRQDHLWLPRLLYVTRRFESPTMLHSGSATSHIQRPHTSAGCTPLLLAAQQLQFGGHGCAAALLTHAAIDLTIRDAHLQKCALHYAAEFNGLELAKACIAVCSQQLNAQDSVGMTPFMLAAQAGHASMVALMLRQGCLDANARDWHGAPAALGRATYPPR